MDHLFNIFDLAFYVVLDLLQGCVVFFGDAVFFIEGSRYVGLILFEEGLDLFSPLVESSFWSLVLLLAASNLLFRPPLEMANSSVGSYVRFNVQKIWSVCFRCPLLSIVVEHSAPLLRSPRFRIFY